MANAAPIVFTNALVYLATSTSEFSTSTASSTTAATPFNLSPFVKAVRLTFEADELDDTVMGLTSRSRVQGLFNWSAELDLLQSFESSSVARIGNGAETGIDKLMFDLINNKVKAQIFVRPTNAARSSDNPEYQGPVRMFAHAPMSGTVGDLLAYTGPFRSAGNLSRLTSSS